MDRQHTEVELRHLEYFIAVAEEGSFTRAAARLHISQPPLSAQIRQLERRAGGPLFVRGAHPVVLTRAGRALLGFAYTAVGVVHRGLLATREAIDDGGETLHVVAAETVNVSPLLGWFNLLRRREPRLRLRLTRRNDVAQEVVRGGADIGLLWRPVTAALWQLTVAEEPLVAIVADGHPLLRRGTVSVADVSAEQFAELDELATGHGQCCASIDELLAAVAGGRVGVLPQRLVPDGAHGLATLWLWGLEPAQTVLVRRAAGNVAAAVMLTDLLLSESLLPRPIVAAPAFQTGNRPLSSLG